MKITLEIPYWCKKENLYLLTRNELVAFKMSGRFNWRIKKSRCNKCGKCCMEHPKSGSYFPLNHDGSCIHLVKDGETFICNAGMGKALACALGEPEGKEHKKFNCSIGY